MEEQQPGRSLAAPSITSPTVSVREQSTSTLATAILSGRNPGETLRRANTVLAAYFDPDIDPETKAALRQEFVVALKDFPDWAVQKAFDVWVKTMTRRPSPGEIVILAARETEVIHRELKIRADDEAARREYENRVEMTEDQLARRREVAEQTIRAAGFTKERSEQFKRAPLALTFAEAEAKAKEPDRPHWSESAPPEDPRWEQLRRARAQNTLIQQSIKGSNP